MAKAGKVIYNPKTGQSIKFIRTAWDTHDQLLEMETTYQPNTTAPAAHYHPYQDEDFRVMEGEVTVKINGALKTLKAGDTFSIPGNTVHAMWNSSAAPATVNWQVRPAMNTEHFLETIMGLAADNKTNENGVPGILQVALLVNKYAAVFRLAKPPYVIQRIVFTILAPFARLLGYKSTYKEYLD